jgi:hypothetical protein
MSIHEDWKTPEVPKQGMSTTVKVLLIVGGIGGVLLLLCCGGIGLFVYKAKEALQEFALTTDADEIETRAGRIAQIDIPPDFEPTLGFDLGIMRWVGYEKTPRDGSRLMLFELNGVMLQNKTFAQQRQEMEQMLKQQGSQNGGFEMQIDVAERETRKVNIRGKPVEFEFNKGTTSPEGKAVRQAIGAFKTPTGVALLNLIVPEEGYDESAVVKMIESIRDPQPEPDVDAEEPEEMKDADDPSEKAVEPGEKEAVPEAAGSQTE